MRLAVSNIAWDTSEDEIIAQLLRSYKIDAIDIAPGKYFPNPKHQSNASINQVKLWWNQYGIEITGMQALLFGTHGLNIFGDKQIQKALLAHLEDICSIAGRLGAPRLVFGSPKNRDRHIYTYSEALDIAIPFFMQLGTIAQNHGVYVCLEPNPICYGANFMTTSAQTAEVVKAVDHPAIRMQLDTGSVIINKEDIFMVLNSYSDLIGHVHLSEPHLIPLGDSDTKHNQLAEAINIFLPQHVCTIEMVATQNEDHLLSIGRAICTGMTYYQINTIEGPL
jgi:sugar phosphate isomerase/epimerase